MPNRREFLKAGIAFTGCGLLGSAQQLSGQGPRRRPVVVSGRRVKTVDVHAHCVVPEATELMGRQTSPQDPLVLLPERLRQMDAAGHRYGGAEHQSLLVRAWSETWRAS